RNFPGSLKGDVKREIARESYLLGLRTLRVILKIVQGSLSEIKDFYKEFLREQRGVNDQLDLDKKADQFCFWLAIAISGSVIKTISYAVGSEQLRETYREVLAEGETPALRLIDVAIKLDHFRAIPQTDIFELSKRLSGNIFSLTILRKLVV